MQNTKVIFQNALTVALFLFVAALTACSKGSVVSDSASQQPAVAQPAAQQPANQQQPSAAQPAATQQAAQAQQATPSPTLHPLMKQAQAQPGVPVSVPDAVKRPLNAEEMKKALEAMPPEVRARIQGMAVAPQGAKPQTTPTPKK